MIKKRCKFNAEGAESLSYREMYREAARYCRTENDDRYYYRGYTEGDALSLYVYDKYHVNAVADWDAGDELRKILLGI